jgi:hypothetical protein
VRTVLELHGAHVPQRGMQVLAIVPNLAVREDGHPGRRAGRPVGASDQLHFARGEERLGDGVIIAVTDRAGGRDQAGRPEVLAESQGVVPAPPIAVVDEARGRPPTLEGEPEGGAVRRWSAMAQPTTRRLQPSRMIAR